jgi:serine phosphatase RsbU (regulator of sigma subunit)
VQQQRYEREHEVATTLQRSLLADVPAIDGVEAAARYEAGATGLEVGGDWYDVVRRPDGIVHATVGDIAGHGVAAAALMGQLRNAFRAYAYEHATPSAVLSRLLRHIDGDEMATAICLTLDPYTRELAYASAGHPPALLRDDGGGGVTRLDGGHSPLLGVVQRRPIPEARMELSRPATIVAYTDGLVEQRREIIDDGIGRLEAALASAGDARSAGALADDLLREVAGVTARDDIALLVLRYAGVPDRVDIELPRDDAALARTRARLHRWPEGRGIAGAARAAAEHELDAAVAEAAAAPADEPAPRLRASDVGGAVEVEIDQGVAPIVS